MKLGKEPKSRVFLQPPPPQEWVWDDLGRPTWFPVRVRGRWATVWSHTAPTGHTMRVQMPALNAPTPDTNPYGRPTLSRDERGLVIFRHRFREESYQAIADDLGFDFHQTVMARAQKGEKALHDLGVLPWARWPDGKLEPGWWEHDLFLNGCLVWIEQNTGISAIRRDATKALRALAPRRRRLG